MTATGVPGGLPVVTMPENDDGTDRWVMLDVGGVMVTPDPALIGGVVGLFGGTTDPASIVRAHYRAMNAGDGAADFDWDRYQRVLIASCGVEDGAVEACLERMLEMVAVEPGLWRYVPPGVLEALAALAEVANVAVISNSNGSAEATIRDLGLAQTGPGRGIEIAFVLDSHLVGVEKPSARIFELAAEAAGIGCDGFTYVGDTLSFDIRGCDAAGVVGIHLDPFDDCGSPDGHSHARNLHEVVQLVTGVAA